MADLRHLERLRLDIRPLSDLPHPLQGLSMPRFAELRVDAFNGLYRQDVVSRMIAGLVGGAGAALPLLRSLALCVGLGLELTLNVDPAAAVEWVVDQARDGLCRQVQSTRPCAGAGCGPCGACP